MKTLWIAPLLLTLAGCASLASQNDPAVDLADAQVAVRTEANGDVIEEYRVAARRIENPQRPAYSPRVEPTRLQTLRHHRTTHRFRRVMTSE